MTDAMVAMARTTAPGIAFTGWTSHDGPPAIQGREDGLAATQPLLDLADRAEASGASGIIIGCFDDTALAEVRSRASCPVMGLGQAAFVHCALRGWRFSVVTTLPVSVPILEENVAAYGYGTLLGRVRASGVPVLALETSPQDASARILDEARAAVDRDRVDAIVLGCAGMVHVTDTMRKHLPCAVIDPVESAAGSMAWLARGGLERKAAL